MRVCWILYILRTRTMTITPETISSTYMVKFVSSTKSTLSYQRYAGARTSILIIYIYLTIHVILASIAYLQQDTMRTRGCWIRKEVIVAVDIPMRIYMNVSLYVFLLSPSHILRRLANIQSPLFWYLLRQPRSNPYAYYQKTVEKTLQQPQILFPLQTSDNTIMFL